MYRLMQAAAIHTDDQSIACQAPSEDEGLHASFVKYWMHEQAVLRPEIPDIDTLHRQQVQSQVLMYVHGVLSASPRSLLILA